MYRWVDAAGTIHFAANPPERGHYQKIDPQLPPPTSAPAKAAAAQYSETYEAQQAKQEKAHEAQLKTKAHDAAVCAKARQSISALENATAHRLYTTQPDGSRKRMTQPEFQKRLNKAKAIAASYCHN